ncbi:MAG: hypothetical protein ABIS47_07990 [Acidimicrobiales bacterium]
MAAGAGVVVAMLVGMSPAFACTVISHIQSDARRGDPGEVVRIEGSGFELHGNPVKVYWGGEAGALLASAPAGDGSFALDITVPANALSGREYLIEAVQEGNPPHNGNMVFRTSRPAAVPAAPAAPAAAAAPDPAPAPAPVVAPAAALAPAPAPQVAADPLTAPVDASGFSLSGAGAFTPSGQPVAPLVTDERAEFTGKVHASGSRSPWVLAPLGLVGLTLFSAAAASVAREAAREGARATV